MFNISKRTREQFVKLNKYPITIYDEPYFSQKLETLELKEEYDKFLEDMFSRFTSENEIVESYYKTKQKMIDYISNKPEYETLKKMTNYSEYPVVKISRPKSEIYKETNVKKKLLSIDLVKANFQAIRYFNPELVDNKNSYIEFISEFTDIEFLKNSKYMRQVVFGFLCCDKLSKIEKHMIGLFIDFVLNYFLSPEEILIEMEKTSDSKELFLMNYFDDELVFDFTNIPEEKVEQFCKDLELHSKKIGIEVSYQIFELKQFKKITKTKSEIIESRTDFYVKDIFIGKDKGKQELKKYDSHSYPFLKKALCGGTISEIDRMIRVENYNCRIMDDVEFKLV